MPGWVVFEDVIAGQVLLAGSGEMWDIALRQASIETITQETTRAKEASESANRAKSASWRTCLTKYERHLNAVLGYSQLMMRDMSVGTQARGTWRSSTAAGTTC